MAKNNKTRFFYVLFADKTWVFDQSERTYGRIYIIAKNINPFEPDTKDKGKKNIT